MSPEDVEGLDPADMGPIEQFTPAALAAWGIKAPLPKAHPLGDAPYTQGAILATSQARRVHYGPPKKPTMALCEWNDDLDQEVYVRDLTDEEFERAMAEWAEAAKEWRLNGGVGTVSGPLIFQALLGTDDHAIAEYVYTERDGWNLLRLEGPMPPSLRS